ncbi:MAG: hypothetical protein M3Q45_00500 [Chloroflexota bacterium]|nr:hypothetical protein [Chloroflexota bacterium]
MPITITLELSPELQAKLREGIARQDTERVYQLLVHAFAPTVETMLQQSPEPREGDTFDVMATQLADLLATYQTVTMPPLSDYAVSRASIYEEHP